MIIIENGEQLRQFRKQTGYTIKQFERASGISHGTICNFENGMHIWDSTLEKIENTCNDLLRDGLVRTIVAKEKAEQKLFKSESWEKNFKKQWNRTVEALNENALKQNNSKVYNRYGYHKTSSGVRFD